MEKSVAVGAPLANYLAAKRVGNMLYLGGVIAVHATARKVVISYDDLALEAQTQLKTMGYVTGQMRVDIFESSAVAQSWFALNRIKEIV